MTSILIASGGAPLSAVRINELEGKATFEASDVIPVATAEEETRGVSGQAVLDAAGVAALAALDAAVPQVPISQATALTAAAHGGRWLVLTEAGYRLSLDWGTCGAGFSCTITNLSTYYARPALTGFTDAMVRGRDGGVLGIRPGGTGALFTIEAGGERLAFMVGDIE